MDDEVRLGYQAAVVSVRSPTYRRHWLSVKPHPGNLVSCLVAEELVLAAEASDRRTASAAHGSAAAALASCVRTAPAKPNSG